jgi:hypothetical protein
MKEIIFAILVILPSAFVVEYNTNMNADEEPVSPLSICIVFKVCDDN